MLISERNIPSQFSQYLRGGGKTLFFGCWSLPLFVCSLAFMVAACVGLSPDCTGQSSVSCASKMSQISQNNLGAGFRLTGTSNNGFLFQTIANLND